jgi:putative membrane protein
MYMLLHLGVLAATVLVLSRVVPGVRIRTPGTAVLVAVVFSLLNFFLGWIVRVILFIPALLTLGLLFLFMSLIVNTVMLWLTDKVLASFEISTRRALIVSSVVITLVNSIFYWQAVASTSAVHAGYGGGPRWI